MGLCLRSPHVDLPTAGRRNVLSPANTTDNSDAMARTGTGLRERKKTQTTQPISDTATVMFLRDGFDAVRVIDIAVASGVSERTVYNNFQPKRHSSSTAPRTWKPTFHGLRSRQRSFPSRRCGSHQSVRLGDNVRPMGHAPEPQITAHAILGLWRVQFRSMARNTFKGETGMEVRDKVIADIRRAAHVIDTAL